MADSMTLLAVLDVFERFRAEFKLSLFISGGGETIELKCTNGGVQVLGEISRGYSLGSEDEPSGEYCHVRLLLDGNYAFSGTFYRERCEMKQRWLGGTKIKTVRSPEAKLVLSFLERIASPLKNEYNRRIQEECARHKQALENEASAAAMKTAEKLRKLMR